MRQSHKKSTQLRKQAKRKIADVLEEIPQDYATNKRSTPFPTGIGSISFSIKSSDSQKNDSIHAMRLHASGQIIKLQEQADLLVNQAHEIKKRVALAEKIAEARFNFKPVLLKIYYLYEEKTDRGRMTLTLIAPEEWKGDCPYGELHAKVRQLGDSTWEILDYAPEAKE